MQAKFPIPPVTDGDSVWTGVNLLLQADSLQPGELAFAQNSRCRNGKPETRKGVVKPVWCHLWDGSKVLPWSTPYGAGIFRDPFERQWHFVASALGVYRFTENNPPVQVPLATGAAVVGPCTFVQAFDKLYLFRGKSFPVLVFEDFDVGFQDIVAQWSASPGTYSSGDRVTYGPWQTVTAGNMTSVGTTATVQLASHGFVKGLDVVVKGAAQSAYNGRVQIVRADSDSFDYKLPSTAVTPATGTITVSNMWDCYEANAGAVNTDVPGVAAKWVKQYNKLPNADNALFVQNRLLVPTAWSPGLTSYDQTSSYTKKDFIAAMDYGDDVLFQWYNQFRINQGSDDEIVDIIKFTDDSVLVFKDRSWGILTGIGENMSTTLQLDMRGTEEGLLARGALTKAGADVLFLAGRRGVCSVRQTENGRLQAVDLPLSQEIDPLIKRINWTVAQTTARLAYWDNYLYAAVPMDGATVNNALLVYDFLRQKWQGYDSGTAICVLEFWHGALAGVDRLFYLGADGYVNVVEEADCGDQVPTGWEEIGTTWRTRAYFAEVATWMRAFQARMVLATIKPNYSVKLVYGAQGMEQELVAGKTRSNTQYDRPFDAPDWVPTNINDDHATPGRQDYAVYLRSDPGLYFNVSGIALRLMQEGLETFRIGHGQGRMMSFEVSNTSGQARLSAVTLEAKVGRQPKGRIQ